MNACKFVTLIVVSVLVAILLASALNSYTRVSDSALADTAPAATLLATAPGAPIPGKNYLPVIFLNSATAGGAWLLSGNAATNPASDFLGTTDAQPLVIRTNNSERLRVDSSGGVGINTSVPSRILDVNGVIGVFDNNTRSLGAGVSTEVNSQLINIGINDDTSNRFGGTLSPTVQGGLFRVDTRSPNPLFQFLGRPAGTGAPVTQLASLNVAGTFSAVGGFTGQCLSNASNVFNANTTRSCNMDFAEAFQSIELTGPGELVTLVTSASGAPTVRKSTNAYDELLIGVVSQNPGLVFDNGQTHLSGDNSRLITADKTIVALVGRVNVKVSMENGAINIGDPLTSSSQPGVAMKATQAGKIIGYAIEATTNDGSVLALVQPGDYVPPAQLDALKQNAQLEARVNQLEQQVIALQSSSAPNAFTSSNLPLWGIVGLLALWLVRRRK